MSKKHKHAEQSAELDERDRTQEQAPQTQEALQEEVPSEEKKSDYYDQLVRLSADFDNYRKRTEREKASYLAYGKKQFAEKLLPSYEVLLRQYAKMEEADGKQAAGGELQSVKDGMRLIVAEMEKAFRSEGIERMDVLNKPYDPASQEAVAMVPCAAEQDGLVLQEVQMGFLMDGKVLRPARVIVGRHAED